MGGSANPNMVQPTGGQNALGGGLVPGIPASGISNQQPQPTPQNPYQQASQAQTDAMGMAKTGANMVSGAQNYLGAGANLVGSGANMIGAGSNLIGEGKDVVSGALGALNPAMQRVGQGMTQTAAEGMSTYQNPYEDAVVQASMRDIGNQGLQMQNTLGAQAQKAGAFGGSRHGIAEAELAKGTQQQMLDQAARLRQQGFNTALGASQADLSRQLGAAGQSAGMAGQAAGMGGQISGMGSAMGGLGSQMVGAGGQMGGFGSALGGLGSTMSGIGSNLSNMGQTSFGYGQAIQNQQMQQGAMQQQMMQNLINAAKGQYGGYTGAPAQGLNTLLQTISAQPSMTGQTSQFQPGLFNYLQLGASMAPN